jgi:hypothetical protein
MKPKYLKLLASTCAVLLIASFFLFVTKKISSLLFWSVAIVCFIVAYKGLPYLSKSEK